MANNNPPVLDEDLLTMSDAPAVAGEIDDLATMSEPVEKRGGEDVIAEDFSPAFKTLVRGDDDSGLLVEFGDKREEKISLCT